MGFNTARSTPCWAPIRPPSTATYARMSADYSASIPLHTTYLPMLMRTLLVSARCATRLDTMTETGTTLSVSLALDSSLASDCISWKDVCRILYPPLVDRTKRNNAPSIGLSPAAQVTLGRGSSRERTPVHGTCVDVWVGEPERTPHCDQRPVLAPVTARLLCRMLPCDRSFAPGMQPRQ